VKVLVIYRHYWPDATSYAWILKAIAERLADEGHQVVVYSAQPSYNDLGLPPRPADEIVGGVRILRKNLPPERKTKLWTRLRNTVLFLGSAVMHALRSPRYDLVLVNTTPAILQGGAARLIRILRGVPYVYNCQDLHPEAGLYGGSFRPGLLYRFLLWQDKRTVQGAAAAVVLSSDMAAMLASRGLPPDNVRVVNNMVIDANTGTGCELPAALAERGGRFRVTFAGNLGRFQGLETMIAAAHLLADRDDVEFLFLGQGVLREELERRAGGLRGRSVLFHDFVPMDVAYRVMEDSDAGIVSLQKDVFRVAYPSKTMMLLDAGCPLLVMVEPESELCRMVEAEELGRICRPGDARDVAEQVAGMADRAAWWRSQRERIRSVGAARFGQDVILDAWSDVIRDIEGDRA
jgi:glycosyltransferase involved in cell wall biosynthesis